MNVQLLLLLALVGPFCAFTYASPTELPTENTGTPFEYDITTVAAEVDLSYTAGPPITAMAPTTGAIAEAYTVAETDSPATPVATVQELLTTAAQEPLTTTAQEPLTTTAQEPLTTTAQEPLTTILADVQTDGFAAETVQTNMIGAEVSEPDEVDIENEGLSSGQVVGIVIGALLAVVIVIAVVIAVFRRMGKYSSAQNQKPAKKAIPLRKKPVKQECPKFWKL